MLFEIQHFYSLPNLNEYNWILFFFHQYNGILKPFSELLIEFPLNSDALLWWINWIQNHNRVRHTVCNAKLWLAMVQSVICMNIILCRKLHCRIYFITYREREFAMQFIKFQPIFTWTSIGSEIISNLFVPFKLHRHNILFIFI